MSFGACVHGDGGPQIGEVTRLGGVTRLSILSLILMWSRPILPHLPGVPHLHVNRLLFINGFSHYGSCFALSVALKQTLEARLVTQKRECNPIFRHGQEMGSWHSTYSRGIWWPWTCEGAFEWPSWLGKWGKFAMFSQNSYNSEFLFQRVVILWTTLDEKTGEADTE